MKQIRKRLTYANVMSSLAVFLVLGGATAFAASKIGKHSVGANQLKSNAVTTAKIKKNAVTAAKIKDGAVGGGKLADGAVSSAKIGAGAVGAGALGANAAGNSQTQLVKVFKAGAVTAAPDQASAPKVELGSVGPFNFYGKCFKSGANISEETYIELTSGQATVGSEDGADFESNSDGYLQTSTPETDRAMEDDSSAGANAFSATSDDEEFQASATDGTEITGLIGGTGAKQGNPPGGNGPFLAGDSCIIGTIAVFGG